MTICTVFTLLFSTIPDWVIYMRVLNNHYALNILTNVNPMANFFIYAMNMEDMRNAILKMLFGSNYNRVAPTQVYSALSKPRYVTFVASAVRWKQKSVEFYI